MRTYPYLVPQVLLSLDGQERFRYRSLNGGPRILVTDIRVQQDLFWLSGYRLFSQIADQIPEGYRTTDAVPEMPELVRLEVARITVQLSSEMVTKLSVQLGAHMLPRESNES
jgi:hypothetical protein